MVYQLVESRVPGDNVRHTARRLVNNTLCANALIIISLDTNRTVSIVVI